ncbi:hypothetical protein [Massilia sp. DWR3-1-1]|uniref:hypothetical protein n=1 Tax=Massilia sp. DWR3-1-1 TaxID=2804559 RepID=UPI003CF532EF
MQQLISELSRLYLLEPQLCFEDADRQLPLPLTPGRLEQHLLGLKTVSLALLSAEGRGRTIVLDFSAGGPSRGEQQWRALCTLANAVRDRLNLPAPAVSISGHGFQLWLSLAAPAPAADIAEFARLLHAAHLVDDKDRDNGVLAPLVELPPGRQPGGKWAAFIHPGMGASFADEPALEMAPPIGAQVGFLEGLRSIGAAEFAAALAQLRRLQAPLPAAAPAIAPAADPARHSGAGVPAGLLLQDATLEDIVAWLHARNIEPTFRHLIRAVGPAL